MRSRLNQWVEVLGGDQVNLTADDIADICWLALIQHQFGVESPPQVQDSPPPDPPKPKESMAITNGGSSTPPPVSPVLTSQSPSATGGLFNRNSSSAPKSESKPLRVPTAPALRNPLSLARALRPVMQQWSIGQSSILDEPATVQRIATEKLWWPVTKPQTETWLELALVVDESSSMLIWRSTISALDRFFKHYGFFRDVRLWGLVAKPLPQSRRSGQPQGPDEPPEPGHQPPTQLYLRTAPFSRLNGQDLRQPHSLIDPTGRRVILVVSDCVDSLWQRPELLSAFKLWSDSGPMAILQMMPEWLWPRTNLRQGTKVSLQGRFKGDANHTLEVVRASTSYYRRSKHEQQADIKVPVITLAADGVENWANLLTARGPKPAAGVILNPIAQRMTIQAQRRRQQKAKQTNSAAYKVQAFRGSSSPISRRLASLLAASPAITLPIIRVIQETLLPRSQQVHVAEVLLGGILRPQPEPSPGTNPEEVQYEFIDPGMRAELLAQAPVQDTTEVLSRYIEDNFDTSLENFIVDLRRLLRTESTEAEGLKPIAIIAAEVLQCRGLKYAEFVQEVKDHYQLTPDTEQIPSPDLQTLVFQTARLIESEPADPDPTPVTPELEPFSFTIATLQRQPGPRQKQSQSWWGRRRQSAQPTPDWVIQRQPGQAYRYVESLPDQSSLELVAIPGGSFLMGSPKDELERRENESPQHEVTVPPFLMGRYPITQAQWRAVAGLPKVERGLDPDPSSFKGDTRPVERVNWYEAMEFCARLSAHTGKLYTLPSEAQWEYACRAGTTTPFHFGETMTPELANYDSNYTYANGPKGEYRQETTPVDQFGVANAWGLAEMHGNVWEWCLDHYHGSYEDAPRDGSAWVDVEAEENKRRILRGGSWSFNPRLCRCAFRLDGNPGNRFDDCGLRVVSVPPRALG